MGEPRQHPILITLTGPEGSGKSTNQEYIVDLARSRGLAATVIKGDRLTCGHLGRRLLTPRSTGRPREYRAEPGRGGGRSGGKAPRAALKRRLRSLRRAVCYLADAAIFRAAVRSRRYRKYDLIVFDRYIYDELAKIVEDHPRFAWLIRRSALRPDRAFLLSGTPEELVARRPRSTPAYYEMSLRRFGQVSRICPELIRIEPGDLETTQGQIRAHLEPLVGARADAD